MVMGCFIIYVRLGYLEDMLNTNVLGYLCLGYLAKWLNTSVLNYVCLGYIAEWINTSVLDYVLLVNKSVVTCNFQGDLT